MASPIVLERIDHGVIPSNDLGRSFRFWSTFMGGRIAFHTNLNARGLNREVPMIIFMTVANHPGFGLALQDFRIAPTPARSPESKSSSLPRACARFHPSCRSQSWGFS